MHRSHRSRSSARPHSGARHRPHAGHQSQARQRDRPSVRLAATGAGVCALLICLGVWFVPRSGTPTNSRTASSAQAQPQTRAATAPPTRPVSRDTTLLQRDAATTAPPEVAALRAGTPRSAPLAMQPVVASGPNAAERTVAQLINARRAQAGCRPLADNQALHRLAREHSTDMAKRGYFSHTTPEGLSPWDRAHKKGIRTLRAENIAHGQHTPQQVVSEWMASPDHRANILNCSLHTTGVGVAGGPGGLWWTQDFGR